MCCEPWSLHVHMSPPSAGYGNLAPSTEAGQIFCVFYALVGIPLNVIFLNHLGTGLRAHLGTLERWEDQPRRSQVGPLPPWQPCCDHALAGAQAEAGVRGRRGEGGRDGHLQKTSGRCQDRGRGRH